MTTQITPEASGVWRLRSTITKKAIVETDGRSYIESFDTGKIYQAEFIAVGIQVDNSRETWKYGGYLSQEFRFTTGSGYRNRNKAFNRTEDLLINDVSIINFPLLRDGEYHLRFFPPTYFENLRLQIWEYEGETTNKLVDDLAEFFRKAPPDLLINLSAVDEKLDQLLANQQSGIAVDLTVIEDKLDLLLAKFDINTEKTPSEAIQEKQALQQLLFFR